MFYNDYFLFIFICSPFLFIIVVVVYYFFNGGSKISIFNKGVRIALRSKVNESVITGLSIVDTILPIGRGQRQLILGDRNTGKTSIFINTLISSSKINYLGTIDGFGSKKLFGIYVAINQNLSKLVKFIDYLFEFHIH
jgi:F-type H+-transporting ATPase subunit alpha